MTQTSPAPGYPPKIAPTQTVTTTAAAGAVTANPVVFGEGQASSFAGPTGPLQPSALAASLPGPLDLGFNNGIGASLVLGKSSFFSSLAATTQTGMSQPRGVAVDPTTGKVFVADTSNNRILRFASFEALKDGAAAEIVLGQPNFTTGTGTTPPTSSSLGLPESIFVDSGGRLWVSDTGNNRVLRFDNAASLLTNAAANGVLGQTGFTSGSNLPVSASTLSTPRGLFVDGTGTLWVADYLHHRVVRFDNAALKANGAAADGEQGQANMFSAVGGVIAQSSLWLPKGVFVDPTGRLWVTDSGNNRVLRFDNAALKADGSNADGELGQPDFVNNFLPNPPFDASLWSPDGITGDANGGLYVADQGNNRILYFVNAPAKVDGASAEGVLGQADFVSNGAATTVSRLNQPYGLYYDQARDVLWAADANSSRALAFSTKLRAALVLGQANFDANSAGTGQTGLRVPYGVSVDPTTGKVFVADTDNHRVLRYASLTTLSSGAAAEAVLGQPDFNTVTSASPLTLPGKLYTPMALMVDASGVLWVADTFNNRVLRFDAASSALSGALPDGVLGQQDFVSNGALVTAYGMYGPAGLYINAAGTLWVADSSNHRVLRFDLAAGKPNGASADGVLGQPDFLTRFINTTQSGMNYPKGLYQDPAGRLWVGDGANNRVLRFDLPLAANGANADGVLGQADFTSALAAAPGTQNGLNHAAGVTGDNSGSLYVADLLNNRVLIFSTAALLPNGANASGVLGQPNYVNNNPAAGGSRLALPYHLFFDPGSDTLWVAENDNSRVTMFRFCTLVVQNTADSGPGSLRAALANVCPGGTVTFDPGLSGQTIQLASPLVLSQNVTLDGAGLASSIILSGDTNGDGAGDVQVLYNPAYYVILNQLTITRGAANVGAGIQNYGTLTIYNSTFVDNNAAAYGGGIYSSGNLYVANSTFANNTAGNFGFGGGIHTDAVQAYVINSTFSGNSTAILNGGTPSNLYLFNTVIGNSIDFDCQNYGNPLISLNNLLEQTTTDACSLTDGINGDKIGYAPQLGPLANNGGPTQTFAPLSGSPAINNGDLTTCLAVPINHLDQRGFDRIQYGYCDIGAVEVQDTTPPVTVIDSGPNPLTNVVTATIAFHGADNFSQPAFIFSACSLDGGAWAGCTSPVVYPGLAAGFHYVYIYSQDELLNDDFPGVFQTWTVDLTPPDTQIDSHVPLTATTASPEASFLFSSPDPQVTAFECRLDGGAYTLCNGSQSYLGLLSRVHTFEVRAKDPAGNVDPTPASYAWMVNNLTEKGIIEFLNLPAVITTTNPATTLKGYLAPPTSLTALTMQVGSSTILTETYPAGTVFEEAFSAGWTPPQDGAYLLSVWATDPLSGTALLTATLLVDQFRPQATLNTNIYTSTDYTPAAGFVFNGSLSDATGVISASALLEIGAQVWSLAVRLDESARVNGYVNGQPVYTSTAWSAAYWPQAGLPDHQPSNLYLRLVDASQIPITVTFPVQLDVTPPAVGGLTILLNGLPAVEGQTYTQTSLAASVQIPAVSDGSSVMLWYGWTETVSAEIAQLNQAADPGVVNTLNTTFGLTVADGGKARYFHLIAVDGYGNTSTRDFGPFYQDVPGMPDYIGPSAEAAGYTNWRSGAAAVPCTLLGVDQRIPSAIPNSTAAAALASAQSFYLTWDATRLHFVWQGADWNVDGDLFIYLDTLPDQPNLQVGSLGAYNPYTTTLSSTVLLLPTREWSSKANFVVPAGAPAVDGMHADYAIWAKTNQDIRLLRWDNPARRWLDDGSLAALGGAAVVTNDTTDLVVPLALVGSPQNWAAPFPGIGPTGMGVVALAVDAPEGPSGGLRVWSALPYANPADSARVVSGAPGPDEPHRMMLTARYVIPVQNGSCFTPEVSPKFFLGSAADGFDFNRFDDSIRLVVPEPSVKTNAWSGLYDPYDDLYQVWLAAQYCPAHPTFGECRTAKAPAALTNCRAAGGGDRFSPSSAAARGPGDLHPALRQPAGCAQGHAGLPVHQQQPGQPAGRPGLWRPALAARRLCGLAGADAPARRRADCLQRRCPGQRGDHGHPRHRPILQPGGGLCDRAGRWQCAGLPPERDPHPGRRRAILCGDPAGVCQRGFWDCPDPRPGDRPFGGGQYHD